MPSLEFRPECLFEKYPVEWHLKLLLLNSKQTNLNSTTVEGVQLTPQGKRVRRMSRVTVLFFSLETTQGGFDRRATEGLIHITNISCIDLNYRDPGLFYVFRTTRRACSVLISSSPDRSLGPSRPFNVYDQCTEFFCLLLNACIGPSRHVSVPVLPMCMSQCCSFMSQCSVRVKRSLPKNNSSSPKYTPIS
eukprot:scaffold10180_cov304-Chaetoceros_neogracile.AAC.8